jgi:hypothetical protein
LVVGGLNTPQPPQLQVSKISEDHIQYKSSSIHSLSGTVIRGTLNTPKHGW